MQAGNKFLDFSFDLSELNGAKIQTCFYLSTNLLHSILHGSNFARNTAVPRLML